METWFSGAMWSRRFQQTLKVVVITSLCWCILDVWILSYFSGCTTNSQVPSNRQHANPGATLAFDSEESAIENGKESLKRDRLPPKASKAATQKANFFDKLIPNGKALK